MCCHRFVACYDEQKSWDAQRVSGKKRRFLYDVVPNHDAFEYGFAFSQG